MFSNVSVYEDTPAPQKTLRILRAIQILWNPINEWIIQQYTKMMLIFLSNFNLEAHMFDQGCDLKWSDLSLGLGDRGKTPRLKLRGVHLPRHAVAELCPVGALGWAFFISFGIMDKSLPNFTGPQYLQDSVFDRTLGISQADLQSTMESTSFYTEWHSALLANKYTPQSTDEVNECKFLYRYNNNRTSLDLFFDSDVYRSHIREFTVWMFPWLDYARYLLTEDVKSPQAKSAASRCLDILAYLAEVVVQDAVVLHLKNPDDPLLSLFRPFADECFRKFAAEARVFLEQAVNPTDDEQHSRQIEDQVNDEERQDQEADLDELMDSVIDWSRCDDDCEYGSV